MLKQSFHYDKTVFIFFSVEHEYALFFCSQLQQVLFFRVLVVHNEISIFHFIRMIFNLVTNYHISLIYN